MIARVGRDMFLAVGKVPIVDEMFNILKHLDPAWQREQRQ